MRRRNLGEVELKYFYLRHILQCFMKANAELARRRL